MASKKKITDREKQFVHYYILKGNATRAAKMAGYSFKNAPWQGYELLKKPHIIEYKKQLLDELEHDQAQMRWEAVTTARAVVNGNPYNVADWNPSGLTLRDPEELDEFEQRTVKKINHREDNSGVHQTFEMENKAWAMDYLAKIFGWYKDPKDIDDGKVKPCIMVCDTEGNPKQLITFEGKNDDPDREQNTEQSEATDHSGDRQQLED